MFGENAERRRAAPISSATEWKMFLNISRRVGSILGARGNRARTSRLVLARMGPRFFGFGQQDLAVDIDLGSPARGHQGCRTVFGDHGGARGGIAVAQLVAVDKGGGFPSPVGEGVRGERGVRLFRRGWFSKF